MTPEDRAPSAAAECSPDDSTDWFEGFTDPDALHYFLIVARCGCFNQAARSLSIKPTLLRKKLTQLARHCGRSLFMHQGRHMSLTAAGQTLRTWLLKQDVGRIITTTPEQPLVRLAIAGPLLQDIVTRDVLAFLRQQANVRLELQTLEDMPLSTAEVPDLILWLSEPASASVMPFADAEMEHLAILEYVPHVAKRYYHKASPPQNLLEMEDYMLVSYQPHARLQAFSLWNEAVVRRQAGTAVVTSYDLMRQMIQWSACVGLLPHYVSRLDRSLQALPGLLVQPIYMHACLAVQSSSACSQQVIQLVELIRYAFRSRQGWFVEAARP